MEMYQQALRSKEIQLELWQSDQFIVSMKQSNVCAEKGLARMRLEARDTSARHRTGEQMSTKLTSLTQRARENPKLKFISLAHLFNEDFLSECFDELNTLLEALAIGCPAVCSRKGNGIEQLVINGLSGYLVNDPDDPMEVIEKIDKGLRIPKTQVLHSVNLQTWELRLEREFKQIEGILKK